MKIQFLGTTAFEGIPSLFCQCTTCKKARSLGGKNIRSRTSVLIHFSHNAGLLHEDLVGIFEPHCMQGAYDGMIIQL
jgi:phosphoribosyl 1,2-cyclic phosphodiesterase